MSYYSGGVSQMAYSSDRRGTQLCSLWSYHSIRSHNVQVQQLAKIRNSTYLRIPEEGCTTAHLRRYFSLYPVVLTPPTSSPLQTASRMRPGGFQGNTVTAAAVFDTSLSSIQTVSCTLQYRNILVLVPCNCNSN